LKIVSFDVQSPSIVTSFRASGSEMDSEVRLTFRWRPFQSHNVSTAFNLGRNKFNFGDTNRWGESAGAISVALQMVTNGGNTEGLFRAGFMQSGAPTPVGDIAELQPFFDQIANITGCADSADKLDCLRAVPEDQFQAATDMVPSISSVMVSYEVSI